VSVDADNYVLVLFFMDTIACAGELTMATVSNVLHRKI